MLTTLGSSGVGTLLSNKEIQLNFLPNGNNLIKRQPAVSLTPAGLLPPT
jgi:hypothetical protein